MAGDCDDVRCGAVFPQGHLSGCRNASRPPKGRASWDANAADAEVEPTEPATYAGLTREIPVYINATEAALALYLGGMAP